MIAAVSIFINDVIAGPNALIIGAANEPNAFFRVESALVIADIFAFTSAEYLATLCVPSLIAEIITFQPFVIQLNTNNERAIPFNLDAKLLRIPLDFLALLEKLSSHPLVDFLARVAPFSTSFSFTDNSPCRFDSKFI